MNYINRKLIRDGRQRRQPAYMHLTNPPTKRNLSNLVQPIRVQNVSPGKSLTWQLIITKYSSDEKRPKGDTMVSKTARYKRLLDYEEEPAPWIRIKFKKYALFTCSIPCVAFTFCVVYSLVYDFHSSTATTCGAYNILPSISSAIGGYSPQREVWKAAISLTFIPRVLLIRDYVQYHLDVCQDKTLVVLLLAILNFLENCALMSLSFYDSTNYYSMHKKSFITFILTSELYMMLLIYLNSFYKLNVSERYGLRLKKLFAATNVCGILLAMYYFIDHNLHCTDLTYTKFAFCEYIVVFSNIAYHTTIIYDFPNRYVIISPNHLLKIENSRSRSKLPLVNI